MMHMIQRENAEGPNLYAKFVNVFATRIPIIYSVNNRTDKLVSLLEDGLKKAEEENREFYALSIGCGPALEVKRFIEDNNPKVRCNFKFIDFDKETLAFASSEVSKVIDGKNIQIYTQLNTVYTLLKRKIDEQKYDLIYCSGLFDYLSDGTCKNLVDILYQVISESGKIFATNMHMKDVDRFGLEVLLDWYLIYRDERVMESFVPLGANSNIYSDKTGISLCLEIEK